MILALGTPHSQLSRSIQPDSALQAETLSFEVLDYTYAKIVKLVDLQAACRESDMSLEKSGATTQNEHPRQQEQTRVDSLCLSAQSFAKEARVCFSYFLFLCVHWSTRLGQM